MKPAERIELAQCPAGGSHHWLYWYDGPDHVRQCLKCGRGPELAHEMNPDSLQQMAQSKHNVGRAKPRIKREDR